MKIKQEHRTPNAEHRTPNAGLRFGSFDVRRSAFGVRCSHFQRGSVLILVLWISLGLTAIALYFANSMTFELRASDNRATGIAAEQAIEGAARYVGWALANFATNGAMPNRTQFSCEAVPVGDAHFWLIGRDPSGTLSTEPYFGLVDEASKLNLNRAGTNALSYLPNMTLDFADAIVDWRSTNGVGDYALDYTSLGYTDKNSPFETVDELRLVYGATIDLLAGEDVNRNGVLDINEKDLNGNGTLDPGLFEYVTVYSREPNFHSDGSSLTNVNTASPSQFQSLFQNAGTSNAKRIADSIYDQIHQPPGIPNNYCNGILDFALRCKNLGMSSDDFTKIADNITTSTNTYIRGRVNMNTASAPVMTALFMGLGVDQSTAQGAAQTFVTYRQQNPNNLNAVSWIVDALGNNNSVITALARGDYVTTRSYQFTADIAAVGPFGRGYRRVKFIFDISEGTPKIIYRQDLSRLGWALGEKARTIWVAKETP
jgi:type II secretory pathway component PulK